jgi:hypothetical protein
MSDFFLNIYRRLGVVFSYVAKGDFGGLYSRSMNFLKFSLGINTRTTFSSIVRSNPLISPMVQTWGIITPPHTVYIAHLIADRLVRYGCLVEIFTAPPEIFNKNYYVVLCAQIFDRLPPGERRILFQLEQSVSSRWFNKEYFHALNHSLAVLDYSLTNIDFLSSKNIQYPHVYYLPIGASKTYSLTVPESEKTYDILFYGDCNSSTRRKQMLTELQKHFKVKICSEIFGHEMIVAIKKARLVINIHYYEDALLELPRIQECLSLGVPIVSETARDQDEYPELLHVVKYFEAGSIPDMIKAVQQMLDNPPSAELIQESVDISSAKFAYMFDRFLIGMEFLPTSYASKLNAQIPKNAEMIALSLPESISRWRKFQSIRTKNCYVFPGLRRKPGWVGCGLSYQYLAGVALKYKLPYLTVVEDDVVLNENFEKNLHIIKEFLSIHKHEWDVFSGLIAILDPQCKVLKVEVYKGIKFIFINKMVSTVFNIYDANFLTMFQSWDPDNPDVHTNTIDRYIGSKQNLSVVVTLPFFVGHCDEMHSTLWGFQNTQYNDHIAHSEALLKQKVRDFELNQKIQHLT